MDPFFSVIMPVYNRDAIVHRAIEAVLAQKFPDFELIIVDDGSTDQTRELCERFSTDPRVEYIQQVNQGVCKARNAGAQKSKGRYLVFLDSDDTVTTNWLFDYKLKIEATKATLIFCALTVIDSKGGSKTIEPQSMKANKYTFSIYIPGSFVLERNLFFQSGMYEPVLKYGENTELSFRICALQPDIAYVNHANLIYEASLDGGSKNWKNKLESNLYIIEKHALLFKKEKKMKQLYLGVAGVAAVHCGKSQLARRLFWRSLFADKPRLKPLLRLLISCLPIGKKQFWRAS